MWGFFVFTVRIYYEKFFLGGGTPASDYNNSTYFSFQIRLPPEVNRILYIRNLPYKITAEEMYDIFGKYGPIRQIRV